MKAATPAHGRPRDPRVTDAILETTLRLLAERGYAGMSVEAVAAEAGVGKTAIYRRYKGKAELAAAAMELARDPGFDPDTGDTRRDLILLVERARVAMVEGPGLKIMGTLLVEADRNPQLIDIFRERIIHPAIATTASVLQRGIRRGEVDPDADIDSASEALMGQIVAHFVVGGEFAADWADRAVDVVWSHIALRG